MSIGICTTCDRALQAQLFDDGRFWTDLMLVAPPLLLGAGLVTWFVHRRVSAHDEAHSRPWAAGSRAAPLATAATLLGLGLGGFLDGIVLHQVLQWHQMLSNQVAPTTLLTKNVNMFWDGIFHLATWAITAAGVIALYRIIGRADAMRSPRLFGGALLFGWGAFNVLDSVANHYLLRLHNVRELAANVWVYNHAFLALGIAQAAVGWWLVRTVRTAFRGAPSPARA
jgi:uncharacterized membrane protein